MEIVLAKEMKRITEDMQIRDIKVSSTFNIQSNIVRCLSCLAVANIEVNREHASFN
jgi:hypothetical protein